MTANRYAGDCLKCGVRVGAGAGEIVKVSGKFRVQHEEGACGEPEPPPAPKPTFTPTAEQRECLDLYLSGASMVIVAAAGSGKTSTLRLLAECTPNRRVLYVAYNKAIVKDVKGSMPRNVRAATAHSLAWHAGGKQYGPRLDRGRQRRQEIATHLGINTPMAFKQADGSPPKMLSPAQLAGVVMQAVGRFCQTADEHPHRGHFPYVEKIDPSSDGVTRWDNNTALRAEMEPVLERAWADIVNPDGWLRYQHDYYLKRWQLTHPRIDVDVVMLDEGQDADPVIAAIVEDQRHAQIVVVGDQNQQIYDWRGAVDALATMGADWPRARLTKSFRFGPAIADAANRVLAELPTDMRVQGHDPVPSVVAEIAPGQEDAILCRTNHRALTEVMEAIEAGHRPYLVGGGKEVAAFAKAARDLQKGEGTEHPELCCFNSWHEVLEFVQQDPQGDELALMVKLVEEFGPGPILNAIDGMTPEERCSVIVSTAHKAKGREWGNVRIASDFLPRDGNPPSESDLRLLYVAYTRARLHLDNTVMTKVAEVDADAPLAAWLGGRR